MAVFNLQNQLEIKRGRQVVWWLLGS
jgi:hypothetical protein